ncbi:DUF2524 family protein [Desertibacillus haloalkaliphilus]|uniref:DUF2524 family protein n=1 Tax=Desertibacillus haloalkaliphilus TaxID=1328930 RepID=UPI001C2585A7|nr:DUF2524 family protein [Desertibacillus haloalkaliphilus]MBU8907307.1 YtzC family protein [Desertibacillus haloalkaliphilus]
MATHEQIEFYLEKVNQTISHAEEQLQQAKQVQPGDPVDYAEAQGQLTKVDEELEQILRSATPEQREQLERAQQRLRQTQNHMILRM